MYATPIKFSSKHWMIPLFNAPLQIPALHYAPTSDQKISRFRKAVSANRSRIISAGLKIKLKVDSLIKIEHVILSDNFGTYDNLTSIHFGSESIYYDAALIPVSIGDFPPAAASAFEQKFISELLRPPSTTSARSEPNDIPVSICDFLPAAANDFEQRFISELLRSSTASAHFEPNGVSTDLTVPSTTSLSNPVELMLREYLKTLPRPPGMSPLYSPSEFVPIEPRNDILSLPEFAAAWFIDRSVEPTITDASIPELSVCKLAPANDFEQRFISELLRPSSTTSSRSEPNDELTLSSISLSSPVELMLREYLKTLPRPPGMSPLYSPSEFVPIEPRNDILSLPEFAAAWFVDRSVEPTITDASTPELSVSKLALPHTTSVPDTQIHYFFNRELAPPITVTSIGAKAAEPFIVKITPPTETSIVAPEGLFTKSPPPESRFNYATIPEPFVLVREMSPIASPRSEGIPESDSPKSSPTATRVRFGDDAILTFDHTHPSICIRNLTVKSRSSKQLKLILRAPSEYEIESFTNESIPYIFDLQEYFSNYTGTVTDPRDIQLPIASSNNINIITRSLPGPGKRIGGNYFLFADGLIVSIGYCDGELTDTFYNKVASFCNFQVKVGKFGKGSVKGYLDGIAGKIGDRSVKGYFHGEGPNKDFQTNYEVGLARGACEYRTDKEDGTEARESKNDISLSERYSEVYCAPGLFKDEVLVTVNYNCRSQGYAGSGYAEGYLLGYLESGYLAGYWNGYIMEKEKAVQIVGGRD